MQPLPKNERIGRLLANGRFQVTEWIGEDYLMGIAIARDVQSGNSVRLTFAGDVSRSAAELRPILTPDVPGLAPVLYLGDTLADDQWASHSMMMAEQLPPGVPLELSTNVRDADRIAAFGARLVEVVRRVHQAGTVLGTIRPESTFVTPDGDITLVARGERLWLMPRPNVTKPAMLPPWDTIAYRAPETMDGYESMLSHPAPSADVFSIAVMLSTWLLGTFVYAEEGDFEIWKAQLAGRHRPLPTTPLGEILTRCLVPDPTQRPSLAELEGTLRPN